MLERPDSLRQHELYPLFRPESIAVVGASPDPQKVGGRPIQYLRTGGYHGRIYPVNPRYEELSGLKCYPNLAVLPEIVDLVVVAVPADKVPEVLLEAAGHARTAIVYSSGFGEFGSEGAQKQAQMEAICREKGLRVLGPNCQGLVDIAAGVVNCWSIKVTNNLPDPPGPVAWIGQSGAVGTFAFDKLRRLGAQLNYWGATGNEADLSVAELMSFALEDPRTKVLAGYIETIKDPTIFRRVAERAREKGIPLVLVKGGRTEAGATATRTHTGSIAGDAKAFDAFFRQCGVIVASDIDELAAIVAVLLDPRLANVRKVAILSNSGGLGVNMSDLCLENGLEVPVPQGREYIDQLSRVVPGFIIPSNPVDISLAFMDHPEAFGEAVRILQESGQYDASLVLLMGIDDAPNKQVPFQIIDHLAEVSASTGAPVLLNISVLDVDLESYARSKGLTCLADLRSMAVALGKLAPPATPAVAGHAGRSEAARPFVNEARSKAMLAAAGLPVVPGTCVDTVEQAVAAADALGYPVALKVVSADIPHKAAAGAMALNIGTAQALRETFPRITDQPGARIEGVLVEKMARMGLELLVTLRRDPLFGTVLVVGLGGSMVELVNDVALVVAPISRDAVEAAVRSLRSQALFRTSEGHAKYELAEFHDLLLNLCMWFEGQTSLLEMELNPVVLRSGPDGGPLILDALGVEA
jgi:acetyltransferase